MTVELLVSPIAEADGQYPEIGEGARRALMRRFPYAVYFIAGDEAVSVIAVLHQHRRPETGRARV